jgi:glycolate oxidase
MYVAIKRDVVDALDVAVPPAKLGELMDVIDKIASKYGVDLPVYGHAGDGNLHVHIMKDVGGLEVVEMIRRDVYVAVAKLGGTITGEHGLGKVRAKGLDLFLSEKHMEIMRKIKRVFDPNGILNPVGHL